MVYIRHRDRMVQESVFNDLRDTLVACRWMAGTTSRPMVSPANRAGGFQVLTTAPNQVLKLAKGVPVDLVDSFPETSSAEGAQGQPARGHTPPNRMAMDDGQPGDPVPLELGSSLVEVPYRFAIAFWGNSVGVCQAVMNDLRDRYRGDAVSGPVVPLYDYNTDADTPVLNMEVDGFSYVRSAEEEVEAYELTLYFAQLTVVDLVDDSQVGLP